MAGTHKRALARLAPLALVALLAACTTPITLLNGWTQAPYGNGAPEFVVLGNIVHLKGGISTTASEPLAFTLPAEARPTSIVYVRLDLCNANKGRLIVFPDGNAYVDAEGDFSDAQCLTSLDGASFARDSQGFTELTMENGWTDEPFGTGTAGAHLDSTSDIVYLKGAISTAASHPVAFTLPVGMRPATHVYVPVDLCDATPGRLYIQPSGIVFVQAENGNFANAQCFTSLDGASFAVDATGFTALPLAGSWVNAPYSTSNIAIRNDYEGLLSFTGAVSGGTNRVITTIPDGLRPAATVHLPVDLCEARNGRLVITTDGVVTVEADDWDFPSATCFTSFEGAQYVINPTDA